MSAVEKLERLDKARPATDRSNAMYRLVAPSKWERARDVESVMDALPQIIAVVEAAERREDFAAPSVARLVADLDEALTVDGKTPK